MGTGSQSATLHDQLLENGKLIPLADVQIWLLELTRRCGGVRPAARTLGVPHSMLVRWIWPSFYNNGEGSRARYIRKHNVEKIVKTVYQLRRDMIDADGPKKPGPPKGRPKHMSQEEWIALQEEKGCI